MNCTNCNGTGRNPGSDYLDCAAPGCTVAADRVALAEFFGSLQSNMDMADQVFAIDQRARQQEREKIAAQAAPVVAASELLKTMADHIENVDALQPAAWGVRGFKLAQQARAVLAAATPAASESDEPSDDYKRGWEDGMKEATELLAKQDRLPKGWYETLDNINWETFGEYSKDTARQAAECCMTALEELEAAQLAAAPAVQQPAEGGWISVDERLPECETKPGSLGIEVLIYPQFERGEHTAFFGCRCTDYPNFYKHGVTLGAVTHWQPLPAAPTQAEGN